mgnify:CR=1 FL=1
MKSVPVGGTIHITTPGEPEHQFVVDVDMPRDSIFFITPATREQINRGEAVEVLPGYYVYPKGCARIDNIPPAHKQMMMTRMI